MFRAFRFKFGLSMSIRREVARFRRGRLGVEYAFLEDRNDDFSYFCWAPGLAWKRSASTLVHFQRGCVRTSCIPVLFSADLVVQMRFAVLSGGSIGC